MILKLLKTVGFELPTFLLAGQPSQNLWHPWQLSLLESVRGIVFYLHSILPVTDIKKHEYYRILLRKELVQRNILHSAVKVIIISYISWQVTHSTLKCLLFISTHSSDTLHEWYADGLVPVERDDAGRGVGRGIHQGEDSLRSHTATL